MVFKTTSIELFRRAARRQGFTLVELMVASGLGGIALMAVMAFFYVSTLTFASLANYADLDRMNRKAVDKIVQEIRQSNGIIGYTTNTATATITNVTFQDYDGVALSYTYNPTKTTLTRSKSGYADITLLTNCTYLNFWFGMRVPTNQVYDVFATPTPATAKVVDVSWKCSRSFLGKISNSENVMTARVVIRK